MHHIHRSLWKADNTASQCACCSQPFSWINRRHHCRACGEVVCGSCSAKQLQLICGDSDTSNGMLSTAPPRRSLAPDGTVPFKKLVSFVKKSPSLTATSSYGVESDGETSSSAISFQNLPESVEYSSSRMYGTGGLASGRDTVGSVTPPSRPNSTTKVSRVCDRCFASSSSSATTTPIPNTSVTSEVQHPPPLVLAIPGPQVSEKKEEVVPQTPTESSTLEGSVAEYFTAAALRRLGGKKRPICVVLFDDRADRSSRAQGHRAGGYGRSSSAMMNSCGIELSDSLGSSSLLDVAKVPLSPHTPLRSESGESLGFPLDSTGSTSHDLQQLLNQLLATVTNNFNDATFTPHGDCRSVSSPEQSLYDAGSPYRTPSAGHPWMRSDSTCAFDATMCCPLIPLSACDSGKKTPSSAERAMKTYVQVSGISVPRHGVQDGSAMPSRMAAPHTVCDKIQKLGRAPKGFIFVVLRSAPAATPEGAHPEDNGEFPREGLWDSLAGPQRGVQLPCSDSTAFNGTQLKRWIQTSYQHFGAPPLVSILDVVCSDSRHGERTASTKAASHTASEAMRDLESTAHQCGFSYSRITVIPAFSPSSASILLDVHSPTPPVGTHPYTYDLGVSLASALGAHFQSLIIQMLKRDEELYRNELRL